MAEEEIKVAEPEEIVIDLAEEGQKQEEKGDPAVKDLVEQYQALVEKSTESERRREEAIAREAAARREAEASRREADAAMAAANSSNLDTITTALASAQEAIESAKRDEVAAFSAGDGAALADAHERMSKAVNLAARYDEAKADLERRQQQKQEPRQRQPEPSDPVEAYVRGRTERTANWLREHRDYVTDQRKNAKLTAAHHDAISEGMAPDTQEYFDHVEKFIGLRKQEAPVTEGDNVARPSAAAPKKPTQRPVAPVGSSSANGGSPASNTVTLSSREAERATDGTLVWNYDDPSGQRKFKKGDPIGVQEFARRKREMKNRGDYDKTYETQ